MESARPKMVNGTVVKVRSLCLSGNISERKSAFSGCEQCLVPEGDLSRWSLRRLKNPNDFNGVFPDRHLVSGAGAAFHLAALLQEDLPETRERIRHEVGLLVFGREQDEVGEAL